MSRANDNTKISSEETLVAKERALIILYIALTLTQPKIYVCKLQKLWRKKHGCLFLINLILIHLYCYCYIDLGHCLISVLLVAVLRSHATLLQLGCFCLSYYDVTYIVHLVDS